VNKLRQKHDPEKSENTEKTSGCLSTSKASDEIIRNSLNLQKIDWSFNNQKEKVSSFRLTWKRATKLHFLIIASISLEIREENLRKTQEKHEL
jgi:hypothetical protein